MPSKFKFEINNADSDEEPQFETTHEAILTSSRCTGHNKNGQQCKRKMIIGFEYCPAHLASEKHLKVKQSTIPNAGKGLFAFDATKGANDIIFRANDKITDYNGVVKTHEQIDQQYGDYTAPYAIRLDREHAVDAGDKRGVGSLVNHKSYSRTNCKLALKRQNGRIIGCQVIATKVIRNGQELFAFYGNDYKFEDPDEARYSTKPYYPRRK